MVQFYSVIIRSPVSNWQKAYQWALEFMTAKHINLVCYCCSVGIDYIMTLKLELHNYGMPRFVEVLYTHIHSTCYMRAIQPQLFGTQVHVDWI